MAMSEKAARKTAVDLVEGWCGKVLQPIIKSDLAERITAALIEARRAALEEAAKVAARIGRPVGAGDGDTYVPGSSADAADAIRALIPTRPDGAEEGAIIGKQLPMPAYRYQTPDNGAGGVSVDENGVMRSFGNYQPKDDPK